MLATNASSCEVYDVWRRAARGRVGGGVVVVRDVAPRDSVFLTLSRCVAIGGEGEGIEDEVAVA